MNLEHYLVIGSYIVGAGSWAFLYQQIKELKQEIASLRQEIAYERGKNDGAQVLARLIALEQEQHRSAR